MIVEIRGAEFVNKGAELMLHAILQRVTKELPYVKFAMAPNMLSPYQKRAALGLYQKSWFRRYKIQWGNLARLFPKKLRDMYGIVLDSEIRIVFETSGFCYSDQWGDGPSVNMASQITTWKRQGTKVILLPQAFGPFSSPAIKNAIKVIADHADLIFAREKVSYDHLVGVLGERQNIKVAPDFTNIVKGILPEDFDQERNRFGIVPNYRMIDKTTTKESRAYVPFLITCAKYLQEKGAKPFILIHEGADDLRLARQVVDGLNEKIEIIVESDPLKAKGILGHCEGVISSRYHSLISALTQGVPALATGWSHKYEMLFDEYDIPGFCISVTINESEIIKKIDNIIDNDSRKDIVKSLKYAGEKYTEQTNLMWNNVFDVVNN